MGFWSRLLGIDSYDAAQRVLADPFEPFMSTRGIPVMDPGSPLDYWTRADVESFWRSQPNVRKVVGYIARNVASIPLHVFDRVSDTDRQRITDHALPRLLGQPQPRMGGFRFWEAVLSDGLLYDRWAVLKDRNKDTGALALLRVPAWRVRFRTDTLGRVESAWLWLGDDKGRRDQWEELPLDDLIFDHGYAPRTAGLSPIETLKDILDETAEAVQYRRDVWENGGLASQWIGRPPEATWSPEQRSRFVEGLRKYRKDGANRGGIMLLEDGMVLHDSVMGKPSDMLDLEGRQLTAVEVASAFYVAPELVGARQGNYSNVDAFRQMVFRDSLGPYITAWEQAINVGLTPDLADGRALYVEANIESKLRGSFQEQAQIMQSATGAPWMTRNEARAKQNMAPVEGGDALVVPLNVVLGGQSSPRDGVTAGRGGGSLPSTPVETAPVEQATVGGFTPDDIVKLIGAAATLIRSGFDPESSLVAVGLDPVAHLGLLPVTVQRPAAVENVDEEIADALKTARLVRRERALRAGVKAAVPALHEDKAQEQIADFFARQGRAVRSRIGAGRDDWWDGERWDGELEDVVAGLYLLTATEAGRKTLSDLGIEPDEYDEPRTHAFLREAARRSAESMNDTTRAAVQSALDDDDDDDPVAAVGHVFDVAESSRSLDAAVTVVTFAAGFGTVEAARQQSTGATKTWVVNSGNPRASHAAMDGETVPLDEDFSNGLPWPGAMGADADETAGCQCSVVINIP